LNEDPPTFADTSIRELASVETVGLATEISGAASDCGIVSADW
jgi:hypothetical protein